MEHRVSFKVYYEDTDSLGVVYYANYFKFMERGRTEYLSAGGVSVAEWNERGFHVVVHSVQAKFKRPAKLGDIVDVVSEYTRASPYRGRFTQRIERQGEVLVDGVVELACTDPDGHLIPMPDFHAAG